MSDLIARAAMDRRITEIITPTVEDLGYEIVRVRLMTGKESILQIMAQKPMVQSRWTIAPRSAPPFLPCWMSKTRFWTPILWKFQALASTAR